MPCQVSFGQAAAGLSHDGDDSPRDFTLVIRRLAAFGNRTQGARQTGIAENFPSLRRAAIDGHFAAIDRPGE